MTRFGLGEEYQAEGGCMEGDTAALPVYHPCSAVRTKCLPIGAAVRFGGRRGVLLLSEVVFSDDTRLFHHGEKFGELVQVRVTSTRSARGLVNLKKLEAFLLLLTEGVVTLGTGEVDAGGIPTLSEEWPTITGIPVVLEVEPKKWIEKILAAWKRLAVKIEKAGFLPIKAMWVIMSFMVSRFDFVASGFAFQH